MANSDRVKTFMELFEESRNRAKGGYVDTGTLRTFVSTLETEEYILPITKTPEGDLGIQFPNASNANVTRGPYAPTHAETGDFWIDARSTAVYVRHGNTWLPLPEIRDTNLVIIRGHKPPDATTPHPHILWESSNGIRHRQVNKIWTPVALGDDARGEVFVGEEVFLAKHPQYRLQRQVDFTDKADEYGSF